MLRMILAALALLVAAAVASADEIDVLPSDLFEAPAGQPAVESGDTDGQAEPAPTYCDRYGPGYEQVPGTTTCIKASGYFSVDVYSRARRR